MWAYLTFDGEGELLPDSPSLPPRGAVFLAFDSLRWQVMIGYMEPSSDPEHSYSSILAPNVDDDCNVVAWAPLDEASEPDVERIRGNIWHEELGAESGYRQGGLPELLR